MDDDDDFHWAAEQMPQCELWSDIIHGTAVVWVTDGQRGHLAKTLGTTHCGAMALATRRWMSTRPARDASPRRSLRRRSIVACGLGTSAPEATATPCRRLAGAAHAGPPSGPGAVLVATDGLGVSPPRVPTTLTNGSFAAVSFVTWQQRRGSTWTRWRGSGLRCADDSRRRLLAALVYGPSYPSELAEIRLEPRQRQPPGLSRADVASWWHSPRADGCATNSRTESSAERSVISSTGACRGHRRLSGVRRRRVLLMRRSVACRADGAACDDAAARRVARATRLDRSSQVLTGVSDFWSPRRSPTTSSKRSSPSPQARSPVPLR